MTINNKILKMEASTQFQRGRRILKGWNNDVILGSRIRSKATALR
jgi:hypothetical protein